MLHAQVQLLQLPLDARQAGVAPGLGLLSRSREACEVRRAGTAGDLAGHLGLRRRSQVREGPVARPRIRDAHARALRRAVGTRRVGASALRLSVPARRPHHAADGRAQGARSEEHTSELQSLMRISYAVFCLKTKKTTPHNYNVTLIESITEK